MKSQIFDLEPQLLFMLPAHSAGAKHVGVSRTTLELQLQEIHLAEGVGDDGIAPRSLHEIALNSEVVVVKV